MDEGSNSHALAEDIIKGAVAVYNNLRPQQSYRLLTAKQKHRQQKEEMVTWKNKASKAQALEAKDKMLI